MPTSRGRKPPYGWSTVNARESKPANVLIVDDDPVMRSLLRKLLELSGTPIAVNDAGDAENAKRLMAQANYECVVLDHVLPDMTGLDFLKWLRTHDRRTPVVVFTGFGDEALAVEMMKAGADNYLTKVGFSAQRFVEAVRAAISVAGRPAMA